MPLYIFTCRVTPQFVAQRSHNHASFLTQANQSIQGHDTQYLAVYNVVSRDEFLIVANCPDHESAAAVAIRLAADTGLSATVSHATRLDHQAMPPPPQPEPSQDLTPQRRATAPITGMPTQAQGPQPTPD